MKDINDLLKPRTYTEAKELAKEYGVKFKLDEDPEGIIWHWRHNMFMVAVNGKEHFKNFTNGYPMTHAKRSSPNLA